MKPGLVAVAALLMLHASPTFGQFPPPPNPPGISVPNCPYEEIGIINGGYYYKTKDCQNLWPPGIGQSSTRILDLGCSTTQPGKCKNPILVAPFSDPPHAEILGPPLLDYGSLTGTPSEKTAAIRTNIDAQKRYLNQLLASSEVLDCSPPTPECHKTRIRKWLNYLLRVENYLARSAPSEENVQRYCKEVQMYYLAHQYQWRRPVLGSIVADDQLTDGELTTPDKVTTVLGADYSADPIIADGKVTLLRVPFSGIQQPVYFKPLIVRTRSAEVFRIAVQVLPPDDLSSFTIVEHKVYDRNAYAHKITGLPDHSLPIIAISKQNLKHLFD